MKSFYYPIIFFFGLGIHVSGSCYGQIATNHYLDDVKDEMRKQFPDNRTINLVFHGHSVPSGYFATPIVNTFDAYPYILLRLLKQKYPYAIINIIVTAKGGENAKSGASRFNDALDHHPDVLFIDYALNDRAIGLREAHSAWSYMIRRAKKAGARVMLLTPSPDLRVDMDDPGNELAQHALQIKNLADEYRVILIDSYGLFTNEKKNGRDLSDYMSQVNHPNKRGHELIAAEILKWF